MQRHEDVEVREDLDRQDSQSVGKGPLQDLQEESQGRQDWLLR